MIAEDRLRELLEEAALPFEPPADGAARIVEAADENRPVRIGRPRFTPPRAILAAAAAVLIVAIGLACERSRQPAANNCATRGVAVPSG